MTHMEGNTNSQIKFKTSTRKSSSYDYSDAYILVSGTILAQDISDEVATASNTNEKIIFKKCAPFTDSIREISNTQVDHCKDIDIVMLMYNLI